MSALLTTAYLWVMALFWLTFLVVGFKDEGFNGWNAGWRAGFCAWALLCLIGR